MLRHLRVRQSVKAAAVFYEFASRNEPLEIDSRDSAMLQILRAHKSSLLRQCEEPV
jgi:hypothetical protein